MPGSRRQARDPGAHRRAPSPAHHDIVRRNNPMHTTGRSLASNGPVLSRARVRHLASRSASGMAAMGCVAFVVFDLLGLTANALPQVLWWAPLLMGFTLGLVSLISVLTAADTLMAIVGGYDGTKKSVNSGESR